MQQPWQAHSYWTRGNQRAGPTWSRRSCSCCHFSCRLRSSSGSHAQNLNCSAKTKKATPWSELDALPGQEDNEPPIWYPRDTETDFHTAKCPLWGQKPFPNVIPFYFDSKLSGCFYAFVLLYGLTETQCLTTGMRRLCSMSLGSMRSLGSTRAPGHGACCPCWFWLIPGEYCLKTRVFCTWSEPLTPPWLSQSGLMSPWEQDEWSPSPEASILNTQTQDW